MRARERARAERTAKRSNDPAVAGVQSVLKTKEGVSETVREFRGSQRSQKLKKLRALNEGVKSREA